MSEAAVATPEDSAAGADADGGGQAAPIRERWAVHLDPAAPAPRKAKRRSIEEELAALNSSRLVSTSPKNSPKKEGEGLMPAQLERKPSSLSSQPSPPAALDPTLKHRAVTQQSPPASITAGPLPAANGVSEARTSPFAAAQPAGLPAFDAGRASVAAAALAGNSNAAQLGSSRSMPLPDTALLSAQQQQLDLVQPAAHSRPQQQPAACGAEAGRQTADEHSEADKDGVHGSGTNEASVSKPEAVKERISAGSTARAASSRHSSRQQQVWDSINSLDPRKEKRMDLRERTQKWIEELELPPETDLKSSRRPGAKDARKDRSASRGSLSKKDKKGFACFSCFSMLDE